jgi:hypothetical protein
MDLLLELGTATWENTRSCQTLDLVFGTIGIQENLTRCCTALYMETGSDHKLIITSVMN